MISQVGNKPKNPFAAIYVRTSSEHQAEKASPDEQENDCRLIAEQQGLVIYKVYRDVERYRVKGRLVDPSGTRTDRPQLTEMLRDAASGRIGTIIAWCEDRLYRAMRAMLMVLECIEMNHLNVILARETFDIKMAPLKAWVAGMELAGMKERMSMGVKARLKAGKANTGQDRYGYRRNGTVIEVVEEEAYWVRKVFDWYIHRTPMMEIRRRLIENGAPQKGSTVPRKLNWAISSIQSIFKAAKEYYFGIKIQRRGGEEFEIPAPPIIDAHTYHEFLRVREANLKHPLHNVIHDYLLSGLIYCACGRKWVSRTQSYRWRRNSKGELVQRKELRGVYHCTQLHKEAIHPDCPRSIGYHKADDIVWVKVSEALNNPDFLVRGAHEYLQQMMEETRESAEEVERISRQMDSLANERQWLITQARKGIITADDLVYQLGQLTGQETVMRQELTLMEEKKQVLQVGDWEGRAREFLGNLRLGLEKLNAAPSSEEERHEQFVIKRQVVSVLVEKILIQKDRELKVILHLNLQAILATPPDADQVRQGGIYSRK